MQQTYVPGTSLLHRLHPLTKLVAAILVIVITYLFPWPWLPPVVFALLIAFALLGGVVGSLLSVVWRLVLPITISLFLIQGLLFPPAGATIIAAFGPLHVTREGLLFAYGISARLVILTTTVLLVLKTTHPADLVNALAALGLPRSIGYILLVSLQIVPDISARATAILEAQRSRGLETERGFFRVGALLPLFTPLVVGALADVEERAMALESRAFFATGPRTTLRVLVDTTAQRVARVALLLLLAGLVVLRFTVFRGAL